MSFWYAEGIVEGFGGDFCDCEYLANEVSAKVTGAKFKHDLGALPRCRLYDDCRLEVSK